MRPALFTRRLRLLAMPWALLCGALLLGAAAQAADRGEEIVSSRCFICHGLEGESSSPIFPRLAGQHAEYVVKQLADFQSGRRKSDSMKAQTDGLSRDDMLALGRYFAAKPAQAHEPADQELAGVGRYLYNKGNPFTGVPACASCHGSQGLGSPQLPRLAGQHARYIARQLQQFNQRERTNDNEVMHSIASKLGPLDVAGLAEYISTLH